MTPPTTASADITYPPFDLALLELPLPNGPALLHHLRTICPHTPLLALCDGNHGCQHRHALEQRGVRFVRRPIAHATGEALRRMVAEVLGTTGTAHRAPEAPVD